MISLYVHDLLRVTILNQHEQDADPMMIKILKATVGQDDEYFLNPNPVNFLNTDLSYF